MANHNPHIGSTLDDLLKEKGLLGKANALALKRVLAWQIAQEMAALSPPEPTLNDSETFRQPPTCID